MRPRVIRKPRNRGELWVRELTLDDLPAVYQLGEKIFPADEWPNLYRTWDPYQLVDLFSSSGETCLVAEIDGRGGGVCAGHRD